MIKRNFFRNMLTMLILGLLLSNTMLAKKPDVIKESKFSTTATGECCKGAIETSVKKINGVTYADLNVTDKVLTVKYEAKKVNPNKIKSSVKKAGYKANLISTTESAAASPCSSSCKAKGCEKVNTKECPSHK